MFYDHFMELIGDINTDVLLGFLYSVITFVMVLAIGYMVSKVVRNGVYNSIIRFRSSDHLSASFIANVAKYAILLVTGIICLTQLGVKTTSLVAAIGAVGLALALAVKDTISNVAAGIMILIYRPFNSNDYVEINGLKGIVYEVNLFTTELSSFDNVKIIIPNNNVWSGSVVNYTAYNTRRVDLIFSISYDDDMIKAMRVIKRVVDSNSLILDLPEPFYGVSNWGESSIDIICRTWVNTKDYWVVKYDLKLKVKQEFDKEGIVIPYPHRTIYVKKGDQPDKPDTDDIQVTDEVSDLK